MTLHDILFVIAAVVLGAIVVIIVETVVPLAIDIIFIWVIKIYDCFRRDSNDQD